LKSIYLLSTLLCTDTLPTNDSATDSVPTQTDLTTVDETAEILEPQQKTKSVYVVADNDFDYGGYNEGYSGKKSKKKYRKQKKKGRKKMKHIAMGVFGLKMLYYHFLMKKMFALSLFSAILSKISILLSSLVAIKQLFQPNHQEKQESKVEVVHIPIHHSKGHEHDYKRVQNEHQQYYNYIPVADQHLEQPIASDRYGSSLGPYRREANDRVNY
jgi:hypothetical protein